MLDAHFPNIASSELGRDHRDSIKGLIVLFVTLVYYFIALGLQQLSIVLIIHRTSSLRSFRTVHHAYLVIVNRGVSSLF